MRRLSIATSHAFILVYSSFAEISSFNEFRRFLFSFWGVDSFDSLQEVRRIIEQIKEQRENYAEIPIVIVGNKTDRTIVREVDEQQVLAMINELGPLHCRFAECTALDRASIIDVFLKLLSLVQLSAARHLSPILRRKVSERLKKREFEDRNDKGCNRSRSLIRRTSMKKKQTSSNEKNSSEKPDCLVSWLKLFFFYTRRNVLFINTHQRLHFNLNLIFSAIKQNDRSSFVTLSSFDFSKQERCSFSPIDAWLWSFRPLKSKTKVKKTKSVHSNFYLADDSYFLTTTKCHEACP